MKNNWGGVWALAMGVSSIMIAEFLPAGLLTPMARDLAISEGMAGQSVTVTSIVAVFASLLITYVTRKHDRKKVLVALSVLTFLSSIIVAFAPNLLVLLSGRVLLGIALGGFWSMATAIALRLVDEDNVPKALSIIFGAASFSAMLAAPLGSFLGEMIGWRNVFLLNAGVGVIGIAWLQIIMPSLNPVGTVKLRTIIDVLNIPSIKIGMLAIALAFCGRFASITYLRPFLEQDVGLAGHEVSGMFLAFDVAYFIGTLFAGKVVAKNLRLSLVLSPLILAVASFVLIYSGNSLSLTTILILVSGAAFAPIPVAWSTWQAKMVPDNTETAGGLYVAAVQMSAAIGALVGGVVFDSKGSSGVFALSSLSWGLCSVIVVLFIRTKFTANKA